MINKFLAVAAFSFILAGCASVPLGDAQKDSAAKQFSISPDKAGVYIYRNESFGAAIKMDVAVDSKPLGQTASKTFFYTEVEPGKHTITSKSENTDTLELDAVAGKLYYVWQEVKMGVVYARTKLHLVSDAEGQKGVLESKLAVPQ
jgi:hypothetical protein